MSFRRTKGIVSDLATSDAKTEADAIITAGALGLAAYCIRTNPPVQFERERDVEASKMGGTRRRWVKSLGRLPGVLFAAAALAACQDVTQPETPLADELRYSVTTGVITPRGPFAYVAHPRSGTLSVIQTTTNTVVATVPVGLGTVAVTFSPDGTLAYVLNNRSEPMSVIETATHSVVATVGVPDFAIATAFTPDGSLAYVSHHLRLVDGGVDGSQVSVIETATHTTVGVLPFDSDGFTLLNDVTVTPDGRFAYVVGGSGFPTRGHLWVIETATNTVVDRWDAGFGLRRVAVAPDGALAYVTDGGSRKVRVFETANGAVVDSIDLGTRPFDVAITPDGAFLYVPADGGVRVIETATLTLVGTVPGFSRPSAVAFTSDGAFAYVTSFPFNKVGVIETATHSLVVPSIPLGSSPSAVAVGPEPSATQLAESVVADLEALVAEHPGTPVADKLEDALASVLTALEELDKTPPDNQAAAGNIEGAVGDVDAALDEGLDPAFATHIMDGLALAARRLAVHAIDDADERGGDGGKIATARDSLAEGDALRVSEAFKDAVNKYKDAISNAEGA